jgi:hypothetical protein
MERPMQKKNNIFREITSNNLQNLSLLDLRAYNLKSLKEEHECYFGDATGDRNPTT